MEPKKEKIVLFCKSYDKDMLRARRLAQSVQLFNGDDIPLYISVPGAHLEDFKQSFDGIDCSFIKDEDILENSCSIYDKLPGLFPPHLLQQLIKLEFWRMGICENYLWLDSDSYFIREFHSKDFFHDQTTPYTVQHDSSDLFAFARRMGNKKIIDDFEEMALHFQTLFKRSGPLYNFGCSPLIWSCTVLESMYEDYLKPRGKTLFDLLEEYPCEMQLYGEYLLFSDAIPVVPIDPLFKIYHYAEQFFEGQMKGESEYSLSREYMGVVMQSNWAKLQERKNPPQIRFKKFLLNFMRQTVNALSRGA